MKATNNKISDLFKDFMLRRYHTVSIGNFEFQVIFATLTNQIEFLATIYHPEDGTIPRRVREQTLMNVVFGRGIPKTKLVIDEKNQQINMRYREHLDQLNYPRFLDLLDELGWVAEQWKSLLDNKVHSEYDFVFISRN